MVIAVAFALAPSALLAKPPQKAAPVAARVDPERISLAREAVVSMDFSKTLHDTVLARLQIDAADGDDPNDGRRAKAFAAAINDVAPLLNERLARAYAETLSAQTLRGFAEFNKTPEGRGFFRKLPEALELLNRMDDGPLPNPSPERLALGKELVRVFDIRRTMFESPLGAMTLADPQLKAKLEAALPEIEAKCAVLYGDLYTADELRGGLAFYRTPAGAEFNRHSSELQLALMPMLFSVMPALIDAAERRYCDAGPCTSKDREDFKVSRDLMAMLSSISPAKAHGIMTRAALHKRKSAGRAHRNPPVIWLQPATRP